MIRKLTEKECRDAIAASDFSDEVKNAAPVTVLALTQSWCPQWHAVESFIREWAEGDGKDNAVLYVEYDREPFFEEFMDFKENAYKNDQVPYIRIYKNGNLFFESNVIFKHVFLSKVS